MGRKNLLLLVLKLGVLVVTIVVLSKCGSSTGTTGYPSVSLNCGNQVCVQ